MDNYAREEFFLRDARDARYHELKSAGTKHLIKYTKTVSTGQFKYRRYSPGGRPQKRFLGVMTYWLAYTRRNDGK